MSAAADKALRLRSLGARVKAEIAELQTLVQALGEYAREFEAREPRALELQGLGGLLQSFYTGLERIFEAIAFEMEGGIPKGDHWHKLLLDGMALQIPEVRPQVLSDKSVRSLTEYLRFRHVYRNVYGHRLEWRLLKPLIAGIPDLFARVEGDLKVFLGWTDRCVQELEKE